MITNIKHRIIGAGVNPVPIVNESRGYVFFWSAKSACSSFGRVILEDAGALERHRSAAPAQLEENHPNFVAAIRKAHNKELGVNQRTVRSWILRDDFYCFKVVREPSTRIISAFVMIMRQGVQGGPDATGVRAALARRFGISRGTLASFTQFLLWLSEIDLEKADIHVRPQFQTIEREYPDLLDAVVRLEHLDDDLPPVEHRLGIDIRSRVAQHYSHHAPRTDIVTENVSEQPFEAYASQIPRYDCFRTPDTERLIGQLYDDDLVAYGYV